MNNVNPKTNVPYGVVSGSKVPPALEEAIFENGKDQSFEAFQSELASEIEAALDEIGPYEGDPNADRYTDERLAPLVKVLNGAIYASDIGVKRAAQEIVEAMDDGEYGPDAGTDDIAKKAVENLSDFKYDGDGARYEYEDNDGNQFIMSTGDGIMIWCIKTDKIVNARRQCSPCVPNAGDLNSGIVPDGEGYECYGVPDRYLNDND